MTAASPTPPASPLVNLADRFEDLAQRDPDRDAVVASAVHLTFRQLDRRANQVARLLRVKGIAPGDAVALALADPVVRVEVLLAALKARAVPFDVHGHPPAVVTALLADCGASGLFLDRADVSTIGDAVLGLPRLHFFVVVDDGSADEVLLPNAVFYEEGLQAYDPDEGWPPRAADDRYGVVVIDAPGSPATRAVVHAEVLDHLDPALAALLAGETAIL